MTTDNITIILIIIDYCLLLVYAIAATPMILRHRKEQKKATTKEVPNVATTTEITANDKDWHIRTSLVEKLRGDIIKGLKSSHIYYLEPGMEDKGLKLSRGEEYELFLPFVKKGYFVYREERRIHLSSIMQYRVTKHRDSETNALEITEEVLTKNAQL